MTITTDVGTRVLARGAAAACVGAALLLIVAGCGSSGTPTDVGDAPGSAQGSAQGSGPGSGRGPAQGPQARQGGEVPGADGKVAAVDGSTAQVQGVEGQTAVTWTSATTFTKEVRATLADVTVGSCVLVASGSASSGSTPATTVSASSVRITPKSGASCLAGTRGPGGAGGPQFEGTPPPGGPSGAPTSAPRGGPQVRGFGGAAGEVTAVSSTGFTVASVTPGSTATRNVAVTVDGSTTYTITARGAASDVKVGVCVQAMGTTDDTGAVTARTIAVSQPRDGQCGGLVRLRSGDGGATTQES